MLNVLGLDIHIELHSRHAAIYTLDDFLRNPR
jgi:hypothetical protein